MESVSLIIEVNLSRTGTVIATTNGSAHSIQDDDDVYAYHKRVTVAHTCCLSPTVQQRVSPNCHLCSHWLIKAQLFGKERSQYGKQQPSNVERCDYGFQQTGNSSNTLISLFAINFLFFSLFFFFFFCIPPVSCPVFRKRATGNR